MSYLTHWILAAVGLIVTGAIVPGFTVKNIWAALFAAIVVGLLNIVLWPILAILTLPLTLLTFGLFLFVVNAIVLKFGAAIVPGFEISGFLPAILGGVVLMLIGWFSRFYLNIPA